LDGVSDWNDLLIQIFQTLKDSLVNLIEAERKASVLFSEIESRGFISPGKTEKKLNTEIFDLAFELFGIRKFWHKRIVRSGSNTLLPYKENPPDLELQEDDILFFDFGPVFDNWEADFGRTYVLGNDTRKHQLKNDVETAWHEGYAHFLANYQHISGAELYQFTSDLALKMGWKYGNHHCGHLVGNFPHETLLGEILSNYIHPENIDLMAHPDVLGNERFWIYEIHFIDPTLQIGGFFEQLMVVK
jgi:Xaa-Pro aminopeptidase